MSLYKHIQVDEAIKEHSSLLQQLRESCKTEIELDPKQFDDDLFLVRFCIAHKGNEEKATNGLKECIEFRVKHKETLQKIASGWRSPTEIKVRKYALSCVHGQTIDKSPIIITDGGRSNISLLTKHCTMDEVMEVELMDKERVYQTCMEETRKQGRIVGFVSLQTQKHGSIWDFDRSYVGTLSNAAKKPIGVNQISLFFLPFPPQR